MPKQFYFSLQKVLDYRFQMEEQARVELSQAQRRLKEQEELVGELEKRIFVHRQAYGKNRKTTQPELWLWSRYMDRLQSEREEAVQDLEILTERVKSCREIVIQRFKDRRLLERLRSKKFLEHTSREQKQEQQYFDEMATIRHTHNNL